MNELEFISKLKENNIELSEEMIKKFAQYFNLLIEYNNVMDLTAVEESEIYERHFFNSLTIAFNEDFNILNLCDVGAGAGFPSIPLKIIFPNMKLTIIDPLSKRMDFLKIVIDKLNLKDVELLYLRAEDASKKYKERFDIVTARAVARLNILVELVGQLVKVNGTFISMKGEKGIEELNEANNALKICNMELIKETRFDRSINLFFKKVGRIDNKYPRNYGQIKKKPL